MERLVMMTAPVGWLDLVFKTLVFLLVGNLLAMAVVFSIHGYFPSGLAGQIIETTLIALPFATFFLMIIGHLRHLQLKLAHLAATDGLTGLMNRRAFFDAVEALRAETPTGYLFLADADHFKTVNDSHGHIVGDQCLVALADKLRGLPVQPRIVGRLGGEEFAVFCPGLQAIHAPALGETMSAPLLVPVPDGIVRLTLSAGAVQMDRSMRLDHAMAAADRALYAAKAQGRGRTVLAEAIPPDAPAARQIRAI